MRQIPLGNFGNVTPGRSPQVSGFGQTARALDGLADTALRVGMQLSADETRNAERERSLQDAEAKRQAEIAEQAARARETAAMYEVEDKLADLHDDVASRVLSRQLGRDDAEPEFNTRMREVVDGAMQQIRPEVRELVGARLNRHAAKLGNGIRRAVEKRDRQDISASIEQNLETFERMYRDDPGKASALAALTIEKLGPASDLSPEALGKRLQGWKEKTQATAARAAVNGALGNPGALTQAEKIIGELSDLDPGVRETQIARIAAERTRISQQAEIAAQRAERLAERRLRVAEHSANAVQALADKGTMLDPKYVEAQLEATRGTPYHAVVAAAAQQAAMNGGQAAKSISQQQADLQSIDAEIARSGRNPQLDKRREQLEKVLRGAEADLKKDGGLATYAQRVTGFVPAPLDMSGGLPSLLQGLQARAQQASEVSAWSGRPESPLLPNEAEMLKKGLDALQPKEKAQWLAAVSSAVGPQAARGLAQQLDPQDKSLALAMAYQGSVDGRLTSELILRGKAAKADGTSTKNEKVAVQSASRWKSYAAAAIGEDVFPDRTVAGNVRDAAEFIMHGLAAEQSGRLTVRDMDKAIRMAVGGEIVEHNGRRIPLPAGMEQNALEKRMKTYPTEELARQAPTGKVRAAGTMVPVSTLAVQLPTLPLMAVRPGQYVPLMGGRPVVNEAGDPVIVRAQ